MATQFVFVDPETGTICEVSSSSFFVVIDNPVMLGNCSDEWFLNAPGNAMLSTMDVLETIKNSAEV